MIVAHGEEDRVARRVYIVWYPERIGEGLLSPSVLASVSNAVAGIDPAHSCHGVCIL